MSEIVDVTLMVIEESEIIETPEGVNIFPRPTHLRDVNLDKNWLEYILGRQREVAQSGEMFAVRLQDSDEPDSPPIYATYILTPAYARLPIQFTGGIN